MDKIVEVLKKIWGYIKKFIMWLCSIVSTSIEIATVILTVFIIFNMSVLSKFWLATVCAVLGILIYNIVKKK